MVVSADAAGRHTRWLQAAAHSVSPHQSRPAGSLWRCQDQVTPLLCNSFLDFASDIYDDGILGANSFRGGFCVALQSQLAETSTTSETFLLNLNSLEKIQCVEREHLLRQEKGGNSLDVLHGSTPEGEACRRYPEALQPPGRQSQLQDLGGASQSSACWACSRQKCQLVPVAPPPQIPRILARHLSLPHRPTAHRTPCGFCCSSRSDVKAIAAGNVKISYSYLFQELFSFHEGVQLPL